MTRFLGFIFLQVTAWGVMQKAIDLPHDKHHAEDFCDRLFAWNEKFPGADDPKI